MSRRYCSSCDAQLFGPIDQHRCDPLRLAAIEDGEEVDEERGDDQCRQLSEGTRLARGFFILSLANYTGEDD